MGFISIDKLTGCIFGGFWENSFGFGFDYRAILIRISLIEKSLIYRDPWKFRKYSKVKN